MRAMDSLEIYVRMLRESIQRGKPQTSCRGGLGDLRYVNVVRRVLERFYEKKVSRSATERATSSVMQ